MAVKRPVSAFPLARRSAHLTLVAAVLMAFAPPVLAASPEDVTRAKQLSTAGAEAFRNKSYEEAIAAFEEANRLVPHPNLDVNIGRAYEALGQPDRALLHCKIALNAQGVAEPTRIAAQQCVERAQKALVRPVVQISSRPDGALVRIDGKDVGVTPWRGDVEAGRRQIDLELKGYAPVSRTLNAERGDVYPVEVILNPAKVGGLLSVTSTPAGATVTLDTDDIGATPLQNFQVDARTYKLSIQKPGYTAEVSTISVEDGKKLERSVTLVPIGGFVEPATPLPAWPGYTMLGVAAAGLGAGTYFGLQALDDHDKADRLARTSGDLADKPRYDKYKSSQASNETLADVFVISGTLLLGGGLTWLLWPDPAPAAAPATSETNLGSPTDRTDPADAPADE